MKPLRKIISDRKKALKTSSPKTRDRLRHQLRVAQVAAQIRKECA
jgi:hypothetical protein